MIDIVRYTPDRAEEWDAFVRQSKNATFLFYRGYMDYHADRFADYSLMFYDKGRLCALLPANRKGETDLWWLADGREDDGCSHRHAVCRIE